MDILKGFRHPERKYSPAAFWFWNGELKPDFLAWQIDEMADKGVYNAFMHARAYLKTPYLEEPWWEAVSRSIERGREKGVYTWLYDEYAWPSGTAGSTFSFGFQKPSRILQKGECNMAKGLKALYYAPGEPVPSQNLVGKYPQADGRTLAFFRKIYPKHVDYMNKQTIREFIEITHEAYRERYGKDFGGQIPGIFFDEIYMVGFPLPWTDSFPEEFIRRMGYDLLPELPLLLEGEEERAQQVRRDYYTVVTALYEEAFFVQISQWCQEHRLQLTGHTEEELSGHPRRQGHYFKTTRHLQIPGADNHDYRYRFPRKITFREPKYAVSVARAYNRERAMSEAMGGAGWGCSLQELKRGINTMGAMGISMFTLHGFYNECEHQGSQADWPTSFFYQNPYWRYFKTFSDYISRICYMNTIGEPVVDVGLYYPAEELYGHIRAGEADEEGISLSRSFDQALTQLLCHQMDADMVDCESLARAKSENGRLLVGKQSFRFLVLPALFCPDEALTARLFDFLEGGGQLFFYPAAGQREIPAPFAGHAGCRICPAEELYQVLKELAQPDVRILSGPDRELYVNHRRAGDIHFYMVSNSLPAARTVTLQLRCSGTVTRLSPETGEESPVTSHPCSNGVQVLLPLEEDEACYLLIRPGRINVKGEAGLPQPAEDFLPLSGSWDFLPLERTYQQEGDFSAEESRLHIPVALFHGGDGLPARQIRICNTAWEPGCCKRHLSAWKASWITHRPGWADSATARTLCFKREVELPEKPESARFCIAAVNRFTLYINGRKAGQGGREPEVFHTEGLQKGKNLIAVLVENDTPLPDSNLNEAEQLPPEGLISLLLEGEVQLADGCLSILSDSSWAVCAQVQPGWQLRAKEKVQRLDVKQAFILNRLPDTAWLSAWERGRPPMLPWGELACFGEKASYPRTVAYTITLPAGTACIQEPSLSGQALYLMDGLPVCFTEGKLTLAPDGRPHFLTVQLTVSSPEEGLHTPVAVTVRPVPVLLGDWRMQGLDWFSGFGRYTNTFLLKKEQSDRRYWLDLGEVHFSAEVWVNGQPAGTRLWAPYRLEITGLLQEGENTVTVVAANSAAVERRQMLVDEGRALGWSRYWNEDNIDREPQNLVSGLVGPVRLYVE